MIHEIPLAGAWSFALDPQRLGRHERWFERDFQDRIELPGSVDEAGKAPESSDRSTWRLTRRRPYVGVAWYGREFTVPQEADGLFHHLLLERVHGRLEVWLDGVRVGADESLSTENRIFLGALSAGQHHLAMSIDNSCFEAVGEAHTHAGLPELAHSTTDHTQTNWNGVIGAMCIEACRSRITNVRVNAPSSRLRVGVELEAYDSDIHRPRFWYRSAEDRVRLTFHLAGRQDPVTLDRSVTVSSAWTPEEFEIDLPEEAGEWSEFSPSVHRLIVEWYRADELMDRQATTFGIRQIESRDGHLRLNGRQLFLRGTLDCCIFPRTGYPPTDHGHWRSVFGAIRAHGLNHVRYHSWCPPRAAFEVADELGMFLQVETPVWAVLGSDPALDRYIYAETERILSQYGNHPSFVMLAAGNEPHGAAMHAFLERFVDHWKSVDSRRLYTGGSGWPVTTRSDYASMTPPRNQIMGQNLGSRLNARALETITDWSKWRDKVSMPVVSHEPGEWCAFPNLNEIAKYDGILAAHNFEAILDDLKAKGRLHLARDLTMASGALQVKLYKEEVEAALRTRGYGGFQLLGLQDFPGQGTAPVGVTDAFWDQKPYASAAVFREFAGPVVPLLRAAKFVYTLGETIEAHVQLAHFGPETVPTAELRWALQERDGNVVSEGVFRNRSFEAGALHDVGDLRIETNLLRAPCEYELVIRLVDTPYRNRWSLWVFEPEISGHPLSIAVELNAEAISRVAEGQALVLSPAPSALKANAALGFTTIFWNTLWTRGEAPHTLGLLNRADHPLFSHFPARNHSDWHWWELVVGRRAFDIDGSGFDPIVRVIDDWNHNRDLALIAEGRIGRGRLLLVSADIVSDLEARPVARCMRNAIAAYLRQPTGLASPELDGADVLRWWARVRSNPQGADRQ